MESAKLVRAEPRHVIARIPAYKLVAVVRKQTDLSSVQHQSSESSSQYYQTYIDVVTPDSGLEAQLIAGSRREGDVELGDHGIDSESSERGERARECCLANEVCVLDVALEANRKTIEGYVGVGLDILDQRDGARGLRIIAT